MLGFRLYPRILQTKEIENAVETNGRYRLTRCGTHLWLGMECNTEARDVEHRKVVGTIAHSHRLLNVDILKLAE